MDPVARAHEPEVVDSFSDLVVRAAVLLRPAAGAGFAEALAAHAAQAPRERRYLSRRELETSYGALPEDLEAVTSFAAKQGLEIVEVHRAGRLVVLRGTLEAFAESFRSELEAVQADAGRYRRPKHPIAPPPELAEVVEGVFGLDNLPRFLRTDRAHAAVPRSDAAAPAVDSGGNGGREDAAPRPRSRPEDVLRRYRFPTAATGKGQTIAILLLGGGFYEEDVRRFFGTRTPRIDVVEVGEGANDPAPRDAIVQFLTELKAGKKPTASSELQSRIWWTLEATVDIELAGSFAPDADLAVYFASNDKLGKIEGLTAVLTDAERDPQVLSCSWGAREADLDRSYVDSVDRILGIAALSGISVCYASGDKGAEVRTGHPSPDYPAACPYVLSCGGTTLPPADSGEPESVWNESKGGRVLATGGGFSEVFDRPAWQRDVPDAPDGEPRRGVPDVAGKADYAYGYDLFLAGHRVLGGGTSAAAPLWAGLLARLNQALGVRSGWITPLLYRPELRRHLTSIRVGGNGTFQAAPGWDACTGWGTPDGEALLRALQGDS